MTSTPGIADDPRPDPQDPDFFARFTLSPDIRAAAFGPSGGTPPPRVVVPAAPAGTGPGGASR